MAVDMGADSTFRHEAFFYAGEAEYLEGTARFLREGVRRGEPALVVVDGHKILKLQRTLGAHSRHVEFADMAAVGANPGRIIPAWQRFVERHAGSHRTVRGIGEPIYPARDEQELVECQRHESLLNVAFAGTSGFWLLCPYDLQALPPEVIEEARRSHPYLQRQQEHAASAEYRGLAAERAPWPEPLPPAPLDTPELAFDHASLARLRISAASAAHRAGLPSWRIPDLVLAVNELASNSLRHGGGRGRAQIWAEPGRLVCEVRDRGRLRQPLADRRQPGPDLEAPRGLWLVNQLCDLLQLRATAQGTVARLHMRLS